MLVLYIQAKALEAFVYLFDYIYSHTEKRTSAFIRGLQSAAELLKNSDLSITEIARDVGYYGDGYLQTAFKKCYGVTPANCEGR